MVEWGFARFNRLFLKPISQAVKWKPLPPFTRIDRFRHHLFFSSSYVKEFKTLKNGPYVDDPIIYICTSAKSDPAVSIPI